MSDLVILGEGLCYLSACAPEAWDGPTVEAAVRRERVAGTSRGWLLCDDPKFADGHDNPCPCEQAPGRKHWLFAC